MTQGFKDFMMVLSLVPVVFLAMVLFIPTLGHSWEWFERLFDFYCKINPAFKKGV